MALIISNYTNYTNLEYTKQLYSAKISLLKL